jgi:branched-chain amino acid transport system permease protein
MSVASLLKWRPRPRTRLLLAVLAVAVLTIVGVQGSGSFSRAQLNVATTLLGFVALSQAWNILGGYGGQMSLGTSAFVGTGGYAAALLELHTGIGYELAVIGAGLAGVVLALLLAVPLLRLRGDYFTIGTLAATLALQAAVLNWSWAGGSTGLSFPLDGVPKLDGLFQLACVITGVAMAATCYVAFSKFGLRLRAVRDDEHAASGLGVAVFRHRLVALAISGGLSGLAGGLIALQQLSFEPNAMFSLTWTTNALIMTIVGGVGTIIGPIFGAVVVYYGLTDHLQSLGALGIVVEGALLVAVVRLAPQGLWPLLLAGGRALISLPRRKRRPALERASAAAAGSAPPEK